MANKDDIKVSVCVVTYNQEKYIAECLQSLVDQETGFLFEIIVSDDCSTDGTPGIIKKYSEAYPALIKPIYHEENIGAFQNFWFVHQKARGEYIAHMDGDDYALPGKLKTQVEFLDDNPECNILWTPVLFQNKKGELKEQNSNFISTITKRKFWRRDLIAYGTVGVNSTKMYRKSASFNEHPSFDVMDYFVNVMQVGSGYATFVGDQPLGVYRVGIGIASSNNKTKKLMARSLNYFLIKFPEFREDINSASFVNMVVDLKNRRDTFFDFLYIYLRTLSIRSFFKSFVTLFRVRCINFK